MILHNQVWLEIISIPVSTESIDKHLEWSKDHVRNKTKMEKEDQIERQWSGAHGTYETLICL